MKALKKKVCPDCGREYYGQSCPHCADAHHTKKDTKPKGGDGGGHKGGGGKGSSSK